MQYFISLHNLRDFASTVNMPFFLQVQRSGNFGHVFKILWAEEKLGILTKGLSPRLFQSVIFSFTIILGYESVKRVSVNEEYKDEVKWWIGLYLDMIAMYVFMKTSFVLNEVVRD